MLKVIKYRCRFQGSPDLGGAFTCMNLERNPGRTPGVVCQGTVGCKLWDADGETYLSPGEAVQELDQISDLMLTANQMNTQESDELSARIGLLKKRVLFSSTLDAQVREERRESVEKKVKRFETLDPDEKVDELMSIFGG